MIKTVDWNQYTKITGLNNLGHASKRHNSLPMVVSVVSPFADVSK